MEQAEEQAGTVALDSSQSRGKSLAVGTSERKDLRATTTLLPNIVEAIPLSPRTDGNLERGKLNMAAVCALLRNHEEWKGVLGYDSFGHQIVALQPLPWCDGRCPPVVWTDQHDRLTLEWIQRAGCSVMFGTVRNAILTVAHQNHFSPPYNYVKGLEWDGVKRLTDWPMTYLGAANTIYARTTGRKWMISAVARICEPGCKVDSVLILEGPQGIGKSSALRSLAGAWFTDQLPSLSDKDAALQVTNGIWIMELQELDILLKWSASKVKAFFSQTSDRFRPPYGRHVEEFPRQVVFAGTINGDYYLKDETGGRRFWPIRCGKIDLEALKRDRDQLWAEAMLAYSQGEPWWLESRELEALAAREVAGRYDSDPWQPLIEKYIDSKMSVTVDLILLKCLKKPERDWRQADKNRIAKTLTFLGWERFQSRIGKAREWRYRRSRSVTT
jgi:predicted P-loop ATPase